VKLAVKKLNGVKHYTALVSELANVYWPRASRFVTAEANDETNR